MHAYTGYLYLWRLREEEQCAPNSHKYDILSQLELFEDKRSKSFRRQVWSRSLPALQTVLQNHRLKRNIQLASSGQGTCTCTRTCILGHSRYLDTEDETTVLACSNQDVVSSKLIGRCLHLSSRFLPPSENSRLST